MISQIEITQTYQLWLASLKIRYRKTWAGFLWVILNPIILLGIQTFIFSQILKLPINNYFLYLVCGYLPWVFISQTLEMGTSLLKTSSLPIKAFSIKPFQIITALLFENLLNIYAAVILIIAPLSFISDKILWLIPLWIISTLPLAISVFSLTFLAATTNILFRDLRFLISFVLSVCYFLTPIFYTVDLVPEKWHSLIEYNPFFILIRPFQLLALSFEMNEWITSLSKSLGLATVTLLATLSFWKKTKKAFYLKL